MSLLKEKSFKLAVRVVNLYKIVANERKEFVMSKQLLRSGTSIGANIREANYFYFTKLTLTLGFYALGIEAASFFAPQRAKKIQRIACPEGKRPNLVK